MPHARTLKDLTAFHSAGRFAGAERKRKVDIWLTRVTRVSGSLLASLNPLLCYFSIFTLFYYSSTLFYSFFTFTHILGYRIIEQVLLWKLDGLRLKILFENFLKSLISYFHLKARTLYSILIINIVVN